MAGFNAYSFILPLFASFSLANPLPDYHPSYYADASPGASSDWLSDGLIDSFHRPGLSCYVQSVCSDELINAVPVTETTTITSTVTTGLVSTETDTITLTSLETDYYSSTETELSTTGTITTFTTVTTDTLYATITTTETTVVYTETDTTYTSTETDYTTVETDTATVVTGTDSTYVTDSTFTVLETTVDTTSTTETDYLTVVSQSTSVETLYFTVVDSETSITTVSTSLSTRVYNKRAAATSTLEPKDEWISSYGADHFRSACSCAVKSLPDASTTVVATQTSVSIIYATVSSVVTVTASTDVASTLSSDVLVVTIINADGTQTLDATATTTDTTTTTVTSDVTSTTTLELDTTEVDSVTAAETENVVTSTTIYETATTTERIYLTETEQATITSTINTVEEVDETTSITSTSTTVEVTTTTVVDTFTATCTSNPVLNGGFDGGSLSPWVISSGSQISGSVANKGYNSTPKKLATGNMANNKLFEMYQRINTCPGTSYSCSYQYYFTNYYVTSSNYVPYCHVYLGNDIIGIDYPSSSAQTGANHWQTGTFSFTSTSTGSDLLYFDCASPQSNGGPNGGSNALSLDNIVCAPS
ncbi:hypothetical protein SCUP515_09316 [Seiridium cupressi]